MEVHERIMPRGIVVAVGHRGARRLGHLRQVLRVERGMPADRALTRGVVAHVAHVGLPGQAGGGHLVRNGLHARRIHAAGAYDLVVAHQRLAGLGKVLVSLAVADGVHRAGLSAHHGHIVVQAHVARAVVAGQGRALRRERLRQIRNRRRGPERRGLGLVLQREHEHVLHLARDRRSFLARIGPNAATGSDSAGQQKRDCGGDRQSRLLTLICFG